MIWENLLGVLPGWLEVLAQVVESGVRNGYTTCFGKNMKIRSDSDVDFFLSLDG